ncbi:MAG: peptidoglycan DD-metalloendopeptidase family protein [Clostridiales bacterium]|nr:peptidoglycan DD-metalloendopeptidase family protein [Clostridiales bacterium]
MGDNASEIAKQIGRRLMELITAAGHGLYRISYITGIRTVRIVRYMGRRIVHVLTPVGRVLYKGLDWLVLRHGRNIGHEFVRIGQGFRIAGRQLKAAFRRHPLLTVPQLLTLPFKALRRHGRALISVLNLAAPVAAAFVLAGTVQYWSNLTFALSLEYDGQQVGYISSEAVFDTAATMAVERVINTDNSFEVQRIPKMTLAVVEKSDILNETEVCDQILKSSSGSIRQASGLYIDGRFEGSMNSREELDGLLNAILSEYTDGSSGERAEFIQNVDIVDGLYPVSSVVAAEAMDQKLSASMVVERRYTVEAGDTPIGIAAKNSMTLEELRSLNANLDDLMLAGKEVLVQRAQPYLRVQVVRTIEYTEPIAYSTEKVEDTTQYLGYEKERNGGQNGERKITAEVTLVDGIEQSRSILATETISNPVNRVVVVGAKKMNANANIGDGVSTGKFVWPLPSCRRISSDYGNRGSFHAGIDISGNGVYGKDIIAADGGTVVEVNSTNWWGQGYGYYVMIDHGGGYVTRYAHCSSVLVTKGQKVTQGQLIAKAGDSGNSQGAHLHFEIRVNGKAVDPKPYLY